MKKILCAALTLVLSAALLSGCSLFTTGGAEKTSESDGSASIKISDKYTFENPADLDYDTRYVIVCGESSPMVAGAADYGMLASYDIIYAKEETPVCGYSYYVCDTEEHAQDLIELYASQGSVLNVCEADPVVVFSSSEGETMEAAILTLQSYGMIKEAAVSAYVDYYAASCGGTIQ